MREWLSTTSKHENYRLIIYSQPTWDEKQRSNLRPSADRNLIREVEATLGPA